MKKYLILFTSLSLIATSYNTTATEQNENSNVTKISAGDIAAHAQFFVKNLPQLQNEEVEELLNFFYFGFLSTHYESAARLSLLSIHNSSIIMNRQLLQSEDEAGKTALRNARQERLLKEELLPLRKYGAIGFQTCLKDIEKSDYTTLKELVVNLQQYCKPVIAQFIKQDKPSIEKIIENSYKTLNGYMEKLTSYTDTFKAILDQKNPYLKEGMDPDVAGLDVSIALADATLTATNDITLAVTAIKAMSVDVLRINTLISRIFYNTLYESLSADQKSKFMIMFDLNGLIPVDKRTEKLVLLDEDFIVNKKLYTL